jgi:hypothetical protein
MSDNKSKTAADRKHINVHDHQELHYWSHRFGEVCAKSMRQLANRLLMPSGGDGSFPGWAGASL